MDEERRIIDEALRLVDLLPDATGIAKCKIILAIAESLVALRTMQEEKHTTVEKIPLDQIKEK